MSPEKTKRLSERFSFLNPGEGRKLWVACGDGWYDILHRLCEGVEKVIEEKKIKAFQVLQIKEKFGGLRFYVSLSTDEIDRLIHDAEQESFKTCEVCGDPGKTRNAQWITTLCEKHFEK